MTERTTIRIARSDQQVSCAIDGEAVVMSLTRQQFYALNATATAVWDRTLTPCSIDEVVEDLVARYAVDPAVCATEVDAVVRRMAAMGMVDLAPLVGPGPSALASRGRS